MSACVTGLAPGSTFRVPKASSPRQGGARTSWFVPCAGRDGAGVGSYGAEHVQGSGDSGDSHFGVGGLLAGVERRDEVGAFVG